jgi:2-dehydropantoate 2-reductase
LTTAVVGVGAVGPVFAAALQETSRTETALCVRSRHRAAVQGPDGLLTALTAPMLTSPAEVRGPADWVPPRVGGPQRGGAAARRPARHPDAGERCDRAAARRVRTL